MEISIILFIHLFFSFLSTLLIFITYLYKLENLVIFNSYILLASFLLPILYFKIVKNQIIKYSVLIFSIINLTIILIELTKTSFLEISLISENLLEILLCFLFYFDYLLTKKQTNAQKTFLWINTAFFIYNFFSFLFNLFIVELMTSNFWYFHNFIEGSSKLLITISLWKQSRKFHQ